MVVATVMVIVLPAAIVGGLSALGVLSSLWAGVLLAVALSLALSSAGSANPIPAAAPPSHTRDDCTNGGWIELGCPNQGQCIADADKNRPDRPRR